MLTVAEVLALPEVVGRLDLVEGPADRVVLAQVLVESAGALEACAPGTLAVLDHGATAGLPAYQLDLAVRQAASTQLAGLVLTGPDAPVLSDTSRGLSRRFGLPVLVAHPAVAVLTLVTCLDRHLAGGARSALSRCLVALDLLEDQHRLEASAQSDDRVVAALATALGVPVVEAIADEGGEDGGSADAGSTTEPLTDLPRLAVPAEHAPRVEAAAARIVLALGADTLARQRAVRSQRQESPARSEAEVLGELLASSDSGTGALLNRARSLGLAVDGWHTVVRVELTNLLELADGDELTAIELGRSLEQLAHLGVLGSGGRWHRTRSGTSVTLLRMERQDAGADAQREGVAAARTALARMRARHPGLVSYVGVSSQHAGSTGLRAASSEAATAAGMARLSGHVNEPQGFDATGLRRTLVEWYSSDGARESVRALLAPLVALGPPRADTAIGTLGAYLDNQGSLSRTADQLHLHRNAVAYRIRQVSERLSTDLTDPDERLLLQLACRAHFLR